MDSNGHMEGLPRVASAPTMSWNPADLLNPKGDAAGQRKRKSLSAVTPVQPAGDLPTEPPTDSKVIFQYMGGGDQVQDLSEGEHDSGQSQVHDADESDTLGLANHFARVKNLLDRSDLPEAKRRRKAKEDEPAAMASTFSGGKGGVLADHIRHMHEQGKAKRMAGLVGKQVETVDLTEGDGSNGNPLVMLPSRPALDKDEEVCFGMLDRATVNCHMVPSPKPEAIATAGEGWWPLVKVVLRRKVDEPGTTIHVYDHTRRVFGKLDAKTACCLSPLLESVLKLRTDCRIPTRRKTKDDDTAGRETSKSMKLECMLYGPRKYSKQIGRYLLKHDFHLLSPSRLEAGVQYYNPITAVLAMIKNGGGSGSGSANTAGGSSGQAQHAQASRTLEEIRSDVLNVFDSLPRSEDLPEAKADPCVMTDLLKHQRQALYFMTMREENHIPDTDDKVVRSIWKRKMNDRGSWVYYNVVTHQTQSRPPAPALGGILADMMGLGKTLSILSLITKTLKEAKDWCEQDPAQPPVPGERSCSNAKSFEMSRAHGMGLTEVQLNGRATLLVCPLSTISNWEEQIKQHIKPNALSYYIYHGPSRIKDAAQLAQYDLVLTTYGSVSSELNTRCKNKSGGRYPLEEIAWFRIVLDEAHMIREQSTLAFKSICRLQANRRWAVTGTPVQNKLEDLGSLLAFLRIKPFEEKSKFLNYIIQPFKNADPEIVPKLRVLIDTITIRRLKDRIDLPPRTDEIVYLDFSADERNIYDWFAKNARQRVSLLTGQGTGQDRILGGRTMIHILRSILQLRLICAHGRELLNDDDLAELKGMTPDTAIDLGDDDDDERPTLSEEKAYGMFYLMRQGNSDNCFKCNRKLDQENGGADSEGQEDILGYMVPCLHIYCPICIKTLQRDGGGNANSYSHCAECAKATIASCRELRRSLADEDSETRSARTKAAQGFSKSIPAERYGGPHTKTKALVRDLLALKRDSAMLVDEPRFKSVVFSGWTTHMDLIEIALNRAGITHVRLDGKMSRSARSTSIEKFREDADVEVLLVSIMAGGLGLNLTGGNTVFVMEPQFNPAAEAQAVDRVHRLGQKRAVRIVRYIMKDSFEEKMLVLQDKKKKLANLSMDGRDKDKVMDRTEAARQRLMDLRSLFK